MFKITNRHFLYLTVLFISLFCVVSACQAASLGETIAAWVVGGIITAIGGIFIWITSLFATLGYMLLTWVTDPGFIKVPVISNDFVRGVGLAITIPLANIVVFVSLVAIGVGTALRIDSYDARKLLMKLFLVALLINFVPILCGVVIDISNILMNFFFSSGNSGLEYFKTQASMSSATIKGLWGSAKGFADLTGGLLLATILLSVFNILTAIVFVLFAVLFLMRYVALWVLVIIAPLMFAFMVLPYTNKWWKSWLDKFTQWCFVGTIAAFYLYLSQQMIALIAQGNLIGGSGPDTKDLGIVEYLLSAFVPVAFLYFGFFEALSGSAMGSGAVINMAKGQARRVGAGSRRVAVSGAKRIGKGAAKSGAAGWVTNKTASIKGPSWGAGQKGLGGWAKRTAAGVVGLPSNTIGAIGTAAADKRDKLVDESKKTGQSADTRERVKMFRDASMGFAGVRNVTDASNIAVAGLTSKDKEGRKAMGEELKNASQKQIAEMIQNLAKRDDKKGVQALYGSVAGKYTPAQLGITDPDVNKKLAKNVNEENAEQFSEETFAPSNDIFAKDFIPYLNASQKVLLSKKNKNFAEFYQRYAKDTTKLNDKEYKKEMDGLSQIKDDQDLIGLIGTSGASYKDRETALGSKARERLAEADTNFVSNYQQKIEDLRLNHVTEWTKEIDKLAEETKDGDALKEFLGNAPNLRDANNQMSIKGETLEKIMNSNDAVKQSIVNDLSTAAQNNQKEYVELFKKVSDFKNNDLIKKTVGSTYKQAGVFDEMGSQDIDPAIVIKMSAADPLFAPEYKDFMDKNPAKVGQKMTRYRSSSPGAVQIGLSDSQPQKVVIVGGGGSGGGPTPPPGGSGGAGPGTAGGSGSGATPSAAGSASRTGNTESASPGPKPPSRRRTSTAEGISNLRRNPPGGDQDSQDS